MKRTFNYHSDLLTTLYESLIDKAFTEFQSYIGWSDDYMQTLLDRYPGGPNFDRLRDHLSDILNHDREPEPFPFEFYVDTYDIQMLDAFAATGDPDFDRDPNFFIYDPKDPNLNDYLVTIYEDPLTKVQFNFFLVD